MIEFKDVTKVFPDGTRAVNGVSLQVPPHRTTVFVGTSGSGKTTLLRMVNRMVDPTSGSIEIDGVDVATRNPVTLRRSIGYVMQNSGLLPHRTVADNIATVPRLEGTSRRDAHGRALELMDLVGLDRGLAERYPAQLSGGQQQRVAIARAIVSEPSTLFADEPTGNLDSTTTHEIMVLLTKLNSERGITVLMVTHEDEVAAYARRIVRVKDGLIESDRLNSRASA